MACLLDYVDAPYNRRNPLRFSHGMLGIHNTDVFRNTRYLLRFRSDMCDDGNAYHNPLPNEPLKVFELDIMSSSSSMRSASPSCKSFSWSKRLTLHCLQLLDSIESIRIDFLSRRLVPYVIVIELIMLPLSSVPV